MPDTDPQERGGYGWETDPGRYTCPRCGSDDEFFCLPLTDRHAHATVLKMHRERGMNPAELERFGYVQYETPSGRKLWAKPGTARCTRSATQLRPKTKEA